MTTNKRISYTKVDILFEVNLLPSSNWHQHTFVKHHYELFYFQRCDLDGDGVLNYNEFTSLMFRQKDRLEVQKTSQRKESKPKLKQKNKGKKK